MQVGNITVRQLFNQDRRHVVPLYQRPYVWQQQIQWEPLWEDIRSVAERIISNATAHAHFIGAIVLEIIESYLVRRLVCQLTTRSYGRFFIDLIATIDGPLATLPERVRSALLSASGESARWPDDEEFRSAWLSAPLYRTILRSRLRMILEALDAALETGYSEQYAIKDKLTVEHLLPQEWKTHWPLPADATAEMVTTRMQLLHTIGNLTLLTKKLNPLVSNGPWSGKVPELKKHSKLNLNLGIVNRWPNAWDEQVIIERGESLFSLAQGIWRR